MTIRPSVPLGKDSSEVLSEGGLDESAIQRLIERGAVRAFERPAAELDG